MRNEILDLLAIDFIENHFDEIDLKNCHWDVKNKEQAIKEIKEYDYMAGWVITEVMVWRTPTNYIEKYKVETDDGHFVIKIDEKYFAYDYENPNYFYEVFPKKVMIEKLIFDKVN